MAQSKFSCIILLVLLLKLSFSFLPSWAQQCGSQASGTKCVSNLCCSQYGYCGSTTAYCGTGCQSGPCSGDSGSPTPPTSQPPSQSTRCSIHSNPKPNVGSVITPCIFNKFFSQRNSSSCPANGFYTRKSFLSAASVFHGFGTTGSPVIRKQELAAFFANVAHETGSGCYVEEIVKDTYCDSALAPCAAGKQYYGRGPIQLSWNYNYQAAGKALGFDGINNPDIVASNATLAFKTAVWYWMTHTCHDAMVNSKGFGATINAINGGLECGPNANQAQQQNRINLYKSFCSIFGVDTGSNLTC